MNEEYHISHEDNSSENEEWSGTNIIIVVVIIFIIIAFIVWYFWDSGTAVTPNNNTSSRWTIIEGANSQTDSFTANNFNLYKSRSPSSGLALTLVAPSDPIGKQFIIDNSTGSGSITIQPSAGATTGFVTPTIVYNGTSSSVPSTQIIKGKVSEYIWQSASTIIRLY